MNEDLLKMENFNAVLLDIKNKSDSFSKRGLSRLMGMSFEEVDLYVERLVHTGYIKPLGYGLFEKVILNPCPFCGNKISGCSSDLYPTGVTWQYIGGKIYYGEHKKFTNKCWNIVCQCGAELHADTKSEVILNWNRRGEDYE